MLTYISVSTKEDDWLQLCDTKFERWNFPNCFAVADGKHIVIAQPLNSGSIDYSYKRLFSIVSLTDNGQVLILF